MRVSPRLMPSAKTAVRSLIFWGHLSAQMQESIAQTRPLIDLGEQFGNLDVRHSSIAFSAKVSADSGVFLRNGAMCRSPSALRVALRRNGVHTYRATTAGRRPANP